MTQDNWLGITLAIIVFAGALLALMVFLGWREERKERRQSNNNL